MEIVVSLKTSFSGLTNEKIHKPNAAKHHINSVRNKLIIGHIAKASSRPDSPVTGVCSHFTVSAPYMDATPHIKKKTKKLRLNPIKSILKRDLFEIFLTVISICIPIVLQHLLKSSGLSYRTFLPSSLCHQFY